MKVTNRIKTLIFSLVAVSALGLIFLPAQQTQKAAQNTNQNSSRAEYINRVSQGLAEAQLSSAGVTPTVAVNAMANAMELRSNLTINPLVREQLTTSQTDAINGKQPLITFDRFADILSDTLLDQLTRLSDEDINQAVKTARGFSAPGIPDKLKNQHIGIFPGYYVEVTDKEAFTQLKAATNPTAQLFIRPRVHSKIKEQAKIRLSDFAKASPLTFGQAWDTTNNLPGKGLTPAQAMLLTYTLVSGDSFADTTTNLSNAMQKKQNALVRSYGSYPSPSGHYAYGANGYLFSSAFALFFNEQNQLTLLTKFSGN